MFQKSAPVAHHEASPSEPSPSRRFGPADLAVSAGLLLLLAFYVHAQVDLGGRPEEDAAMLLRYSRHLAAGHGIVWNEGDPPLDGATDFLFMVMVAAAHRLGASLEGAARGLGLAAHAATALLIYLGIRRFFRAPPAWALVPCVFFILGPGLRHLAAGYATPFFTLCAAVAWLLTLRLADAEVRLVHAAASFAVAALLLGLARPEGVLLGGFMLVAVLAARRGAEAPTILSIYLGVFLTFGLGYFLWRWSTFGYPLPNPFYAKGRGVLHWHSFRMAWRDLWMLTFPFGLLLSLGLFFRACRRVTLLALLPILAFVCLWILISDEANYVMRLRAPLLPLVLVSCVPVGQAIAARLKHPAPAVGAVLALTAAAGLGAWQHHRYRFTAPRRMGLHEAAVMLSDYAPRNFCLVTTEAGLLPLYSGWRAVDAWGLNDAWIAHHGSVTEEYLDRYRPELIVFHAYFSPGTPASGPRIENRSLGPRWYQMVMTLKRYAESRGYVRAAVFGRNAYDTHWYFVRTGFPQSSEIVSRIRALDYWWDGEPTMDLREGDGGA